MTNTTAYYANTGVRTADGATRSIANHVAEMALPFRSFGIAVHTMSKCP